MLPLREYYEVWVDGRLVVIMTADSLSDALTTALREFPRRAIRVRLHNEQTIRHRRLFSFTED